MQKNIREEKIMKNRTSVPYVVGFHLYIMNGVLAKQNPRKNPRFFSVFFALYDDTFCFQFGDISGNNTCDFGMEYTGGWPNSYWHVAAHFIQVTALYISAR